MAFIEASHDFATMKDTPRALIDPRLLVPGLGETVKTYLYSLREQELCLMRDPRFLLPHLPVIAEYLHTLQVQELALGQEMDLTGLIRMGALSMVQHRDDWPNAPHSAPVSFTNPNVARETDPPSLNGIVTDNQLAAMASQDYDGKWMIKLHLSNNLLNLFTSLKRFDNLVNRGALKVGDRLYYAGNASRVYVAEILGSADGTPSRTQSHPNVGISIRGIRQPDLQGCRGPSHILQTFKVFNNNQADRILEPDRMAWQLLRVRRGATELGTVFAVRQAYHLWEAAMNDWSERNNLPYRRRRAA